MPAPQHQPKAAILLIGTNDLGAFARVNKDPTDAAPDAVRRFMSSLLVYDSSCGWHAECPGSGYLFGDLIAGCYTVPQPIQMQCRRSACLAEWGSKQCRLVCRLTAIVGLLRNRLPSTHVLLAAVLPRGARASDKYAWPNKYSKVLPLILLPVFAMLADCALCRYFCSVPLQRVLSNHFGRHSNICSRLNCCPRRASTSSTITWRRRLPARET